jgi:putative transposase
MVTHDLNRREMKGLAVASTIGKRDNPDVTIKRYNKLSYKVKSQSSADTWYTVINSYSDGWICDCPDFSFRHLECKHIHSVKFSKLLRKQVYQDSYNNLQESTVENKTGQIICQRCSSTNYKKFGVRHNKNGEDIQRYLCKDCGYRFAVNPAFENSKASSKVITAALDLYFKGVSLRKVADHIKQFYNFEINFSSICRWIRKFTKTVQHYVDSLIPSQVSGVYHVDEMMLHVRKENNEIVMNLNNQENHTHKSFDNHYSWLWNLMDSTTRFWICSKISQKRDVQAGVELLQDMKQRAPLPKAFVHDGLRTYDEAYQKELFTLQNPRIKNVRSLGSSDEGLNPKIERLNGTMRDRETVMRGLDNAEAAQQLVDAMRIHYNFIRPNQAIGGQTPAEAAGISLNLGENKIENLMRQAAIVNQKTNLEPFVFELGVRVNKLVISRKDDSIEIKTKEFLDKKNWREINEILLRNGFKWLSLGKDSCWIKII